MSGSQDTANSGINALLGFEFQRNCALYLLLSEYSGFKERDFFLCIEHHDDFLFCYRSDCQTKIEKVSSYQAKKRTGTLWKIDGKFSEIITKILAVGNNLINDTAEKSENYIHELVFISNMDINLKYVPTAQEKKKGKVEKNIYINDANLRITYNETPDEIKNKIDVSVGNFCKKEGKVYHHRELNNLHIQWIDFPRSKSVQIQQLVGLMSKKFPHVSDPSAAIRVLLDMFGQVEAVYNQGKVISLLDSSKRVEGLEIKKTIDIIETKQKTFELWRNSSKDLSLKFKIPIGIQIDHETYIGKTFELLKDISNSEHQKIKEFVRDNNYNMDYYSYEDIFLKYLSEIKLNKSLNLNDTDIFFAILCSYVEYYDVSST